MAWIYLPASEDSPLRLVNGSDQFSIVRTTDMLNPFCFHECGTEVCHELLSGTTCGRYQSKIITPKSTSFMEASLVRTSVLRAAVKAWEDSEVDFLARSCAWPKKQSPSSYSLRMSQQLELVDSTMLPNHWPSPGMIVDGILYPLKKSELVIYERDGSVLPTPTACDYGKNNGRNTKDPAGARDRWSLTCRAARGDLPGHPKGRLNPSWIEQVMGYCLMWTEVDALVMQWFRIRPKKLLRDC